MSKKIIEEEVMAKQIGGLHYKTKKFQVWDIVDEYKLNFYEASALKYLLRDKSNRVQDLKKLIHYAEKEILNVERKDNRLDAMIYTRSREEEMSKLFDGDTLDVSEFLNTLVNSKGFIFPMETEVREDEDYQNLLKDDEHEENIEKVYGDAKEVSLGKGELFINKKSQGIGEIFCRFR